ncbi:hypothetical protein H2201_008876 [Coniosporium apollinis]|uniref:Uncharacterized protein n=1 Tax=Coniosporium apollinis TaxID=61459 RepID=A0ABQ9NHS6_9PEZI|nr:hypothetical protein H2201_008876 [Coniosporium apollinis]
MDWIASALADRQSFVELSKPGGDKAKRTVLLDVSLLLLLVLSIGIVPLSARLFATRPVVVSRETPMLFTTKFSNLAINLFMDGIPVLDTVAATRIYQGSPIPWTNKEYTFRSFSPADPLSS